MADTVRLRCISPLGARDLRDVPAVARIVEVDEVIDVPTAVAGQPAGIYRPLTELEEAARLAGVIGGLRLRGGDEGPDGQPRPLEIRDPGHGLLAQPEHWELVTASKPATKK